MIRRTILAVLLIACASSAYARGQFFGYAQKGGNNVSVAGFSSSNKVQLSYPGATVSVFNAGTAVLSTLYSNAGGTAQANPLTAGSDGSFTFWTDTTTFDITFSGAGITTSCGAGFPGYPCISAFTWTGMTFNSSSAATVPSVTTYGAKCDGITDDSVALQAAITANSALLIPAATCNFATTLTLHNGLTISGVDMQNSSLAYTGTGDGMILSNTINLSGYGRVYLRDFTLTSSNAANTGGGVHIDGAISYIHIDHITVTASFKYGIIFDQTSVSDIKNSILQNGTGIAASTNVYLVNGADFHVGANTGYTNVITIQNNQFNNAVNGIIDDGGNAHIFLGNNFNAITLPIRVAACQNCTISGNSIEGLSAGISNIYVTDAGFLAGTKGVATGGSIVNNTLSSKLSGAGSGSLIQFTAAGGTYHSGFTISNNYFGAVLGRLAGLDVTSLSNSFVGANYDAVPAGGFHYAGVHNDANGNVLWPPLGSGVGGQGNYLFGVSTVPVQLGYTLLFNGIAQGSLGAPANGATVYCTDCKNSVDNAVVVGAVCVAGGNGALAVRINATWRCY